MIKQWLIIGMIAGAGSGCSTTYTCGQFPSSGCQPVSSVYQKTNSGFHDYRKTLYARNQKAPPGRQENALVIKVAQAHQALDYASPGDPLLSRPVTLRILFNAWVDKDKDLNAGGFYFVKLKDSEWVQGQ